MANAWFLITSPSAVFPHTSLSPGSAPRSSVAFRAVGTSGTREGLSSNCTGRWRQALRTATQNGFCFAKRGPGTPTRCQGSQSFAHQSCRELTHRQQSDRTNQTVVLPAADDDERGAPTCHRLSSLLLDPEFWRHARTKMSRNFTRTNCAAANVADSQDGSQNRHEHEASSCC